MSTALRHFAFPPAAGDTPVLAWDGQKFAATTTPTLQSLTLSGGTASNVLTIGDGVVASPSARINGPAGGARDLGYYTAGSARWVVRCEGTLETGADAGSNYAIIARHDDGTQIDVPFQIGRASGGSIVLTRPLSGTSLSLSTPLPVTSGGSGVATASLGDLRYGSGVNTIGSLAGNTTSVLNRLTQTGTGAVSAAPAWTPAVDVQVFTSNGSWTKPAWATKVTAIVIGSGGGGGSGKRGADGAIRTGGSGGGGGGRNIAEFDAAIVTTPVSVTIGAIGTGGAAQTSNDTSGNPGSAGATSTFGTFCRANGGGAGAGGTAAAVSGGGGGNIGAGGAGGAAPTAGTAGAGGSNGTSGASGGGAGGSLTAGNAESTGGAGGNISAAGTGSGTAGAVTGGVGGDATGATASTPIPGAGGGGGGSSETTAGGNGGNGGIYGGGGGGGGASSNGNNSGKGGDGALGIVIIISQ